MHRDPFISQGELLMNNNLFPSTDELKKIGEVALRKRPPTAVISGGSYLNVYTDEIVRADIWTAGRFIAKVTDEGPPDGARIIDVSDKLVVPGFIDGHIHVESTLLDPINFSRAAIDCGVTGIVTDFHEAGVTCGKEGLIGMKEAFQETPLKAFWVTPISLPFLPDIQTTVSSLSPDEALELLDEPDTLGLSEVMSEKLVKALLAGDDEELEVVKSALLERKLPEGHLFKTFGDELDAMIGFGVGSDHEPREKEEVVEKINKGLFVMLREGTLASEVQKLVGVVPDEDLPRSRFGLVSDDILARDMTPDAYMIDKVKKAVERDVEPIEALKMVTYNIASHFRVDNLIGTVKSGSFADLVVLDSLEELKIERVIVSGTPAEELEPEYSFTASYGDALFNRVPRSNLTVDDLNYLPPGYDGESIRVRTIWLNESNRFTHLEEREVPVRDDGLVLDGGDEDLLYLICASRVKEERIGLAFLERYGLEEGGLAVSIAHDHHGIVALGKTREDVVAAANWVIDNQGGVVYVKDGKEVAGLPLPLAGLMATEGYEEVRERIAKIERALEDNGASWKEPLFLSFWLGMEVAPYYRISERGILDTEEGSILPPVVG